MKGFIAGSCYLYLPAATVSCFCVWSFVLAEPSVIKWTEYDVMRRAAKR